MLLNLNRLYITSFWLWKINAAIPAQNNVINVMIDAQIITAVNVITNAANVITNALNMITNAVNAIINVVNVLINAVMTIINTVKAAPTVVK